MGVKPAGSEKESAEHCLRLAVEARDVAARVRWASEGLSRSLDDSEPDTQLLLLRQLYLAHVELKELPRAAEIAEQMTRVGSLRDTAYHDLSRIRSAMGDARGAIDAQRLAARAAPPDRRSFHLWCLATLHEHAGDLDSALDALERAESWAQRDRPLIRAHAALVELEAGRGVPDLAERLEALADSRAAEGYGQFLHGMIAHLSGDRRTAAVQLRAFLRRNASADTAKTLTLREELRRARTALAEIESV